MQEFENLIKEVHDYYYGEADKLDPDVRVSTVDHLIFIKYFNYEVHMGIKYFYIKECGFYSSSMRYVTEPDVHFELTIMDDYCYSLETAQRIIKIREYYKLESIISEKFKTIGD